MREVGGGDPDSEENIPTFWDTVLKEQKDETMLMVDCPNCNKRLRVPETYSGRITAEIATKYFSDKINKIKTISMTVKVDLWYLLMPKGVQE